MSEYQNSIDNRELIVDTVKRVTDDINVYIHREQTTITVPMDKLEEVASELKNNEATYFDMCVDVTGIDWLDKKEKRYDVLYFLYSLKHNHRVRLKVEVDEDSCESPTLSGVWESANWYERETYDMYGIVFKNHPDMRRYYMPEDYADPETGEPLYPLRKDFPLMGIPNSLPLPAYPEKYGEVK